MNTFLARSALVLFLAAAVTPASSATAGLVIMFEESGANVVATLSGSFTALPTTSGPFNAVLGNRILNSLPYFDSTTEPSGTTVSLNEYFFVPANSFPVFGTSSTVANATSVSGLNTSVLINVARLGLPPAFSAGTSFTGSLNWAGQSLASLALTPGSYTGTLSNSETVTINVVPEPTTSASLLAGLTLGGYSIVRRRKRA